MRQVDLELGLIGLESRDLGLLRHLHRRLFLPHVRLCILNFTDYTPLHSLRELFTQSLLRLILVVPSTLYRIKVCVFNLNFFWGISKCLALPALLREWTRGHLIRNLTTVEAGDVLLRRRFPAPSLTLFALMLMAFLFEPELLTKKVSVILSSLLRYLLRCSHEPQLENRNLLMVDNATSLLDRIVVISLDICFFDKRRRILISIAPLIIF